MGMMSRIAKMDSALQRGVDNSFARVFGGRVVPAELLALLKETAEEEAVKVSPTRFSPETASSHTVFEAPNVFIVELSTKDFDSLSTEHPHLGEEFRDELTILFIHRSWQKAGPLVVHFTHTADLHVGQFKARTLFESEPKVWTGFEGVDTQKYARTPQQPEPTAYIPTTTKTPAPTVTLLIHDGSNRSYQLQPGSTIIGRKATSDVQLPDSSVSREHAEITWDGAEEIILVDLHSSNGTLVNGMKVDNWMLAGGDVITVGRTHIEVRIT